MRCMEICGKSFLIGLLIVSGAKTIHASEVDALDISGNIQRVHMPYAYGTVLDLGDHPKPANDYQLKTGQR